MFILIPPFGEGGRLDQIDVGLCWKIQRRESLRVRPEITGNSTL
jgi:hypothetical protein